MRRYYAKEEEEELAVAGQTKLQSTFSIGPK